MLFLWICTFPTDPGVCFVFSIFCENSFLQAPANVFKNPGSFHDSCDQNISSHLPSVFNKKEMIWKFRFLLFSSQLKILQFSLNFFLDYDMKWSFLLFLKILAFSFKIFKQLRSDNFLGFAQMHRPACRPAHLVFQCKFFSVNFQGVFSV